MFSFICLFVIHKILKEFMKIVWRKHNLIISSVGSGHPDQYSYEIPHENLSEWENLSEIPHENLSEWENLTEKIISTKRKHYFKLRILFSSSDFPCRIYSNFFYDSFVFGEVTSSHFFRVNTSTKQFLFRSNYTLKAPTLLRSSFSRTVASFRQLFLSE